MHVRPATFEDQDAIMKLYDAGRSIMRENGNYSQWINGYPSNQMVSEDIERGQCFVVCDDVAASAENRMCGQSIEADSRAGGARVAVADTPALRGVFMFALGDDPTYAVIEDGAWLNDEPYGVIHRISSDGSARGILRMAVDFALARTNNVRIDTHADNAIMQRALQKAGFARCGTIFCHDGTPRIAFQLAV